jgi:hypothetical protein
MLGICRLDATSLHLVTISFHSPEPRPVFVPVIIRNLVDMEKLERLRSEDEYEVALNRVYFMKPLRPTLSFTVSFFICQVCT